MAELLEKLAGQYESSELAARPYFSANAPWRIDGYRDRIRRASELREIVNLRFDLMLELLWDGRTEEALSELQALEAMRRELTSSQARRMEEALRLFWITAYLRLAEQRNCLTDGTADACLLPIRKGGVHTDRGGSEAAVQLILEGLDESADDLALRWLLNVVQMTLGDWPEATPKRFRIEPEAFASEHDVGFFRNVGPVSGAAILGLAGGSVLEDLDGDGRLDIVASSCGLRDPLRLLRNRGDGTFEDRTADAGLTGEVGGLNISHTDYDNDGNPDVLVLRGGWLGSNGTFPPSLLRNLGDGTFEDVTERVGLLSFHPGQTSAWADFDNDGNLDLFLGHESIGGDDPHPSSLYHGNGDGTFTDWGPRVGLAELGWVKGAAWGDYDNDRDADLYVSRLGQPNLLFRNDGPGPDAASPWSFREVAREAGVVEPEMSFPTWFFDYNNDGWLDLFVGAWDAARLGQVAALYLNRRSTAERPRLYLNLGDGRFEDVTGKAGLDRVLLAMGANFGDIDNDGFEDVYVGTGATDLWMLIPNRMFRNDQGRRFQDVTTSGGFGHLQKGHGISFGDVDEDGDQDVYAVMGGWYSGDGFPNALFENPGHGNHWITLHLEGVRSNRPAIGARIQVTVRTDSGDREIHRVVGTGGSFGSSSLQQEIGLGRALSIRSLRIEWPASGVVQVFRDVPMDQGVRIREGADRWVPIVSKPFSFSDSRDTVK
jgi:hypothetical protein